MNTFTHLHLHTQMSLLDSCIKIKELMLYLREHNMSSCACTDHGWCAGVLDFQEEAKKVGIHSILGIESYVTEDPDNTITPTKDNYHLVLLAKDNEGLKSIFKLASEAHTQNFYYKPRIYRPKLEICSGHVVVLTGCLASQLFRNLSYQEKHLVDDTHKTEKLVDFYLKNFGEDFYLELQDWPDQSQQLYNQFLLDLGRRRGIPFVITGDCHYLRKEDHELHELMMAMQLKMTLQEYRAGDTMRYGPYFYVRPPEEMLRSTQELECEEAYGNTGIIANKCHAEIPVGKYKMPTFDIKKELDYAQFLAWKENQCKFV